MNGDGREDLLVMDRGTGSLMIYAQVGRERGQGLPVFAGEAMVEVGGRGRVVHALQAVDLRGTGREWKQRLEYIYIDIYIYIYI
jgi:hypothetical protein